MSKVTIYTTSEFMGNVCKYEGTLIEHGTRKYAQYDNAPYVDFVPRGKRKPLRIQKAYKPYLLIVEGWGAPEPEPMCTPQGGMSKYSSFDDGWRRDFNALIEASGCVIIADYRK